MRDLLFKNLTSSDKKKRVIISSEVYDERGYRSIIRRHFVCMIKEVKYLPLAKPVPYIYVLKQRNTKEQKERFFCRIKGSVYVICKERLYLVLFMHSLKIDLLPVPQGNVEYN